MMPEDISSTFWIRIKKCETQRTYFPVIMIASKKVKRSIGIDPVLFHAGKEGENRWGMHCFGIEIANHFMRYVMVSMGER